MLSIAELMENCSGNDIKIKLYSGECKVDDLYSRDEAIKKYGNYIISEWFYSNVYNAYYIEFLDLTTADLECKIKFANE